MLKQLIFMIHVDECINYNHSSSFLKIKHINYKTVNKANKALFNI